MAINRDISQFGNEKGLSTNHYLINMLNKILLSVDQNSNTKKMAVIMNMIDWSQAFERQSHFLGIKSFIKNGVRRSLIPLLINFFQERYIMVKWNSCFSQPRTVKGGGPQGGTAGIVEYISLTNGNLNFLEDDEKFKFVDASFLEILNILAVGLTSFNAKLQVPTDIATDNLYLPTQSTSSQSTLDKISNWTTENQMKLNSEKN